MNFAKLNPQTELILEAIEGLFLVLDLSANVTSFHCKLDHCESLAGIDACGRPFFDLFAAAVGARPSAATLLQHATEKFRSESYISRTELPGGDCLFLKWRFSPIATPAGKIRAIAAIGQKIPEAMVHSERMTAEHDDIYKKNKELTSLYGISQIVVDMDRPLQEKLRAVAELLLPVFRYPQQIKAHIRLDGVSCGSEGFEASTFKLSEDVIVRDEKRGIVQVGYLSENLPGASTGTVFLEEERQFLHKVARLLAFKLERRELTDQLKHADRLATIGQLAAGIAHELNNPLTDILGFAQLASSQPDLPEETYQDLEKIVKSSLYAREVIKRILFFSRQSHPKIAVTNLNHMISEWMEFFHPRCSQKNIKIILDLDPKLPATRCDPGQLNQVLVNIVVNAMHAMPGGGLLTIRTGIADKAICILVQDTGTGIKADIFDKIFLPFFTTKDVDQGTGLGLSVVYGIIKEHGGTISVQSREGQGSTFEVRLPLMES